MKLKLCKCGYEWSVKDRTRKDSGEMLVFVGQELICSKCKTPYPDHAKYWVKKLIK